jgi:hypothetical protein
MNLTVLVESADGCGAYFLRLAKRSQKSENTSRSLPHFEKERYVLEGLQSFEFIPRVIVCQPLLPSGDWAPGPLSTMRIVGCMFVSSSGATEIVSVIRRHR